MHEAPCKFPKEGGSIIIFPLAHSGKPLADEFFKLLPEQKAPPATHISRTSFAVAAVGSLSHGGALELFLALIHEGSSSTFAMPNLKPFWETAAMELKSHDPQRHAER